MHRYRHILRTLGLMAVPLAVAVPIVGSRAAVVQTRPHTTVQVAIQNFAFSPQKITVAPGTTVVWTQKDSAPHTISSDTNAWKASAQLNAGQTFSHTFARAGTYSYHCAVHPYMTGTIIVSSHPTQSGGSTTTGGVGMMGAMGPMSKAPMTSFTGWYDKHKVLFLATDTSSKAEAMSEHINYSASMAKSLPNTIPIYMVTNGAFAKYGAVFGSQPGEDDYTPLWREVVVTWKTPSQAVALGRDDQIKSLAKAGKVTLKMTGTVLNCPIIKVMGGS